jgi:ADP-ribose pyrophosphatase YjhB (NUDIX family)
MEFSRQFPTTGKAALAIVENEAGLLLSISREHDPTDMTLPGGKLEANEDWLTGLVREVREETNATIMSAQLVHQGRSDDDHFVRVYRCLIEDYGSVVEGPTSEGVVKWVKPKELVLGCFRGFNTMALSSAGIRLSP